MKYLFPLVATHRNGDSALLYSVAEYLAFHNSKVGDEWITYDTALWYRRDYINTQNDWIVRDDRGHPVKCEDFPRVRHYYWRREPTHTFRDGPVPNIRHSRAGWKINHTAKKNGGVGAEFRRETRAAYDALDIGEFENTNILKVQYQHKGWCSCDRCEGYRSTERCWKVQRKTQWK